MSKQSGLFVFTATPELAKAMPRLFKTGATYTVQRASGVIQASSGNTAGRPKQVGKKVESSAKKPADKGSSPKPGPKAAKPVKGKRGASPEAVLQFVRENDGCNMTQIEAATKLPQPMIRKELNDARESGQIRTEGQRRGLRYFANSSPASAAAAPSGVAAASPVG